MLLGIVNEVCTFLVGIGSLQVPISWITHGHGHPSDRGSSRYDIIGCKNILMYSGFKLTNTGQVWNITSTVLRLPLLEISLRYTDGEAERLFFGTCT
jgi:hypothetical protein